jgi:type I restriction enzyme R subunit
LTGFDVPSLSTLYLDKPLKAHTLMQAIARANRVNEGKNNGLIVDYCGILKHLRKALATFAGTRPDSGDGEIEPARPHEDLLADLDETISLVRVFLDERGASLADIIRKTGFERNAAIVACKEVINENDETRKRFEVMCRAVFRKFRACINVPGVNACRASRDAVDIVYRSLQRDREQADISDIIRSLHRVVDEAIETRPDDLPTREARPLYDVSRIDFDRLRQEFESSTQRRTIVQSLRHVVEQRLKRLLAQNPLRTDFQRHYEGIVADYNREKDRVTIERTFEDLLKLARELDEESARAVREGLDEESLAIFDLLKKETLAPGEIESIKQVARSLLETLKAEKLRIARSGGRRNPPGTRCTSPSTTSSTAAIPACRRAATVMTTCGKRPKTCSATCTAPTPQSRHHTTSTRLRPERTRGLRPVPTPPVRPMGGYPEWAFIGRG